MASAWEQDDDPAVWGPFGSRSAWEEEYKKVHGFYPGQGPESYEEAVRNLLWSQSWQQEHGTQPITEEVWKGHYYRPTDFKDYGQFEQRASSILEKYRQQAAANAIAPKPVAPIQPYMPMPLKPNPQQPALPEPLRPQAPTVQPPPGLGLYGPQPAPPKQYLPTIIKPQLTPSQYATGTSTQQAPWMPKPVAQPRPYTPMMSKPSPMPAPLDPRATNRPPTSPTEAYLRAYGQTMTPSLAAPRPPAPPVSRPPSAHNTFATGTSQQQAPWLPKPGPIGLWGEGQAGERNKESTEQFFGLLADPFIKLGSVRLPGLPGIPSGTTIAQFLTPSLKIAMQGLQQLQVLPEVPLSVVTGLGPKGGKGWSAIMQAQGLAQQGIITTPEEMVAAIDQEMQKPTEGGWISYVASAIKDGTIRPSDTKQLVRVLQMPRIGYTLTNHPEKAEELIPKLLAASDRQEMDAVLRDTEDPVSEMLGRAVVDAGWLHWGSILRGIPVLGKLSKIMSPTAEGVVVDKMAEISRETAKLARETSQAVTTAETATGLRGIGALLKPETYLNRGSKVAIDQAQAMTIVGTVVSQSDTPEQAINILQRVAAGEGYQATKEAGQWVNTRQVRRLTEMLKDAGSKVTVPEKWDAAWKPQMVAAWQEPVQQAAAARWGVGAEKQGFKLVIAKVGSIPADMQQAYRIVLGTYALYMRPGYAVQNFLSDTFFQLLDSTFAIVSPARRSEFFQSMGMTPEMIGSGFGKEMTGMTAGPISQAARNLTQKIPTFRKTFQGWEQGRREVAFYAATSKALREAKRGAFQSAIRSLPREIAERNPELVQRIEAVFKRAETVGEGSPEIQKILAGTPTGYSAPILEWMPQDLQARILSEKWPDGMWHEMNRDWGKALESVTTPEEAAAAIQRVSDGYIKKLRTQLASSGVSGDMGHVGTAAGVKGEELDTMSRAAKAMGVEAGEKSKALAQYAEKLREADDGVRQGLQQLQQSTALTPGADQVLMVYFRQLMDAEGARAARVTEAYQQAVSNIKAGIAQGKPGAAVRAEEWGRYWPQTEKYLDDYKATITQVFADATQDVQRIQAGEPVAQVLSGKQTLIEREMEALFQQTNVDEAAKLFEAGAPGVDEVKFQAMVDASRQTIANARRAAFQATLTAPDRMAALYVYIDAEIDYQNIMRVAFAKKAQMIDEVLAGGMDAKTFYPKRNQLMRDSFAQGEKRWGRVAGDVKGLPKAPPEMPASAVPEPVQPKPPTAPGVEFGTAQIDRTKLQEGLDAGLPQQQAREAARIQPKPPAPAPAQAAPATPPTSPAATSAPLSRAALQNEIRQLAADRGIETATAAGKQQEAHLINRLRKDYGVEIPKGKTNLGQLDEAQLMAARDALKRATPGTAEAAAQAAPEAAKAADSAKPTFIVVGNDNIQRVTGWTPKGEPKVVYPGKVGGIHPKTGMPYEYIQEEAWRPATASDFSKVVKPGGGQKMIDLRMWQEEFSKSTAKAAPEGLFPSRPSTTKEIAQDRGLDELQFRTEGLRSYLENSRVRHQDIISYWDYNKRQIRMNVRKATEPTKRAQELGFETVRDFEAELQTRVTAEAELKVAQAKLKKLTENAPTGYKKLAQGIDQGTVRAATDPPAVAELRTPILEQQIDEVTRAIQDGINANWAAVNQGVGNTQDAAAIAKWVNEVVMPNWKTAEYAAKQAGKAVAEFTMGSPAKTYLWDSLANYWTPYSYWATRQGVNTSRRVITRPALLSNYVKMQEYMNQMYETEGYPERAKNGKLPVTLPNGDIVAINVMNLLVPYAAAPLQWDDVDDENTAVGTWVEATTKFGIRPHPWILAGLEATGNYNPTYPTDLAWYLPFASQVRFLKSATATTAALAPGLGIPPGGVGPAGKWDNYYRGRALRTLLVRGVIDETVRAQADYILKQAEAKQITWDAAFQNPAVLAAEKEVAKTTGIRDVSSFMLGTSAERIPKEELQFRKEAAGIPWWNSFQPEPAAHAAERSAYFDKYPAAAGVPKTLAKAAEPYFWNMYYGLPPKSAIVDDESVQAVLEAEDRKALDVKVWTNAVEVLERFYLLHPQTPEQKKNNEAANAAHKVIVAQVNATYPGFSELQDAFYSLPEDSQERKDFKYRNPRLEKGWELKHNLENADPLLSKYYGTGTPSSTSGTGQPSSVQGQGVNTSIPIGTSTSTPTGLYPVSSQPPAVPAQGIPFEGGEIPDGMILRDGMLYPINPYGLYPMSGHWPGYGNIEVAADRLAAGQGVFRHAQPRTTYGGEWRARQPSYSVYGYQHANLNYNGLHPEPVTQLPNLWAYKRRNG